MSLETPVLFCVFNRPDLSRRVFETIARQRPRHLLVSCDGPRAEYPGDADRVAETQSIIDGVDWPCSVSKLFRETNRGCRQQMADAITWAFDRHERVIILEDDCLPDPSFFGFCEQLLDRFADDPRVMMISGDNFQPSSNEKYSYYFSGYSHIWGWASWRRAWQHFDLDMSSWPDARRRGLTEQFSCNQEEQDYWNSVFDRQHRGQIETWDYSWAYACWKQNGLTVLPEVNLVSNIGFRPDGTHTVDSENRQANRPARSINSVFHPPIVARNTDADSFTWHNVFKETRNDGSGIRAGNGMFNKFIGRRAA